MRAPLALSTLLAATVTAVSLQAQISPAPQAKVEGNNAAYFPLGYRTTNNAARQVHYQQVHDDVTRTKISGMAFRRDSKAAYFYDIPTFFVDMEIALSTARTTARTISNNFANNEGSDRKVVLKRKRINFPKAAKFHTLAPQPLFAYSIKFDSQFAWTTPKSLCWDLKMYNNNVHGVLGDHVYLDAVNTTATNIPGFNAGYGRGCFSSNPGILNAAKTESNFAINPRTNQLTLTISGCHFTPNSQGFAMVGLSRTSFRGSASLPIGLGPMGAPGCSLLQSWDVGIPVKLNFKGELGGCATGGRIIISPIGGGTATKGLKINTTHNKTFEGLSLYSQIFCVDPKANSLQVVVGHASHAIVPLRYQTGLPANRVARLGTTAFTSAIGARSLVAPWATIVRFN